MRHTRVSGSFRRLAGLGGLALLTAISLGSRTAAAQNYCQSFTDVMLDTSSSCVASPARDRAFGLETFRWKGGDYLIMSRGNELQIQSLDDPTDPRVVDTSSFRFGTVGDSDYDVMAFDVCDDCRYGVMDHKVAGAVVFDLGTGSEPHFGSFSRQGGLAVTSMVFAHGGQQYLLSRGVPSGCNGSTALFAISGVNNLSELQCPDAAPTKFWVKGGVALPVDADTSYLYLGLDIYADVHLFRAEGSGLGLSLQHLGPVPGMVGIHGAVSIDRNYDLAVSADRRDGMVRFWDVSDPASPDHIADWDIEMTAGRASLRSANVGSPLVLATTAVGFLNSARTFLVDPADGPAAMDNAFWTDLDEPHNEFQSCVLDQGSALAPDGSAFYVGRYALAQAFDLSQCLGPTPAVAEVTVTPAAVFPGGTVTARDTTTGSYDRWAVWIERNGTLVAGTSNPSAANPHQLSYTVPDNVAESAAFTAFVEVESDDLAPQKASDSTPITVDRTPEAGFTITPDAAVVGDPVTLAATAEGNPTSYNWVIDPPLTGPESRTGSSVSVTLDESGAWNFTLTVNYNHAASGAADPDGDGLYEDVVSQTFTVSSVAADFTVSPAVPLNNAAITLNGSISKGAIASYLWTVYGPTNRGGDGISPANYNGCPAAAVCTIPADTLEWGAYTITLKVSAANGEWDDKVRAVTVANGAIQPTFSWAPSSPEIGQSVVFTIGGVQVPISKATWTTGGTGCDGASSTQVCTPSLFNDCKALAFKYASGGNKIVGLTVIVDGVSYSDERPSAQRTVTVANTGSCSDDGGGGPVCSYELSDDGAVFGPNGGDGAFTVFTSPGCSWTASESLPWVRITSGTSDTGTGAVRFAVDPNAGRERSGYMLAAGKLFRVTQEPPYVPANFTMSKVYLEIGEPVTFTVDPVLEVESWDFGEPDCRGSSPVINCAYLPVGACNTISWNFPSPGEKAVTMRLADGRSQTKGPTVRDVGECCIKDGRPSASFTASTDEPFVGEQVLFTDTSAKLATAKALGFSWLPTTPEIGENTVFTLTGLNGEVDKATWSFGQTGCAGASATQVCTPGLFNDCTAMAFRFASGGSAAVSVQVQLANGGTVSAGPFTVTVLNSGSCDGGGGEPSCSYSLSPTSADFEPAGGSGQFSVATTAGCTWAATTSSSWLHITSGSGSGPSTVLYTVDENAGASSRTGYVRVEGRSHTVRQDATAVEADTAPTAWLWTVSRVLEGGELEDIATSSEQHLGYAFAEPGDYRVTLQASNCVGDSKSWVFLTVVDAPVTDFVVGAAVKVSGANATRWETDLRFHNPCGEPLAVRINYEPEGTNNSEANLVFREFELEADQTRVFADITEAIPGLVGEELSGSVRIISGSASGCKVLSVSRTYNSTPSGSLGLFVPALPVKRAENQVLDLTGLARNSAYRSNLRLVNYGDADVWVPLRAFDRFGEPISNTREALVPGHSTKQLNDVAGWLGVSGEIAPFSVRAEVEGLQVQAYATVVDNQTGDSVLSMSSFSGDNRVWVAGVASTAGVNDSRWRTDLWLFNPTEDWLAGELEFVVGTKPEEVYGFAWPDMKALRVRDYLDLVGDELNLEEKSGYLVLNGAGDGPAPQVAARTYNLALDGGTFGLGLRTFTADDLLQKGETGYIIGVSNSADPGLGFRTNLGLLNTDRERWLGVRLTLVDVSGVSVGEPLELMIAPGVLRQFDLAERFGVGDTTVTASLVIEVTEGGGLAAYATEIDNRTQDSIFIPVQRKVMGAPQ